MWLIESNQTLLCLIHHVAKPWMRLEVLLLHDVVAHAPHDLMLTKRAGACMKSTTGAHKTQLAYLRRQVTSEQEAQQSQVG